MARDLQPGETLAGYRIERLLGRGGMAAVYLAEHDRLKRKVALKVLSPELALDETFRQRFVAESERLASVDHPNIIPVYEAGEHDSVLYIAMRYVETTDLKHLIAQEGGLDAERAIGIVSQVAAALDAAHAKGMVHRDVKPANVLVAIGAGPDGSDHAYLSDFGLTKRTEETTGLTRTGYFLGTIDYVAPEQISGKGIDGRTDQYALACVLFESLAGRSPYARDEDAAIVFAHLSEPPPSLTAIRPDLPVEIDAVVATGMAKNKDDRYPYCVALARAARAAVFGPRAVTPPAGVGATVAAPGVEPGPEPTLVTPPPEVPAPPPAPPAPEPPPATPPGDQVAEPPSSPPTEPGPEPAPASSGSRRGLLVGAVLVVAALGVGGFVLLSGDDEDAGAGSTGTGLTGAATGATGQDTGATGTAGGTTGGATGGTGDPGVLVPPLAEAQVFGTWSITFNPEDDLSAGSAVASVWVLDANCDDRAGPHPCDVDAIDPMRGFLQRQGKAYSGTVTGDFLCGPADMSMSFEVTEAASVDGPWRATEIRGEGTMLSGDCPNDVFVFVGTLA
jgi:serine/threonine-protein kinase